MKIAILTMVFNERHFLPIWIQHYGAAVGRENLYIVDDGSDDGSTTGLGQVKVMRSRKEKLDEDQRAAKMSAIQAELLTIYDAVIVTDADELIVPDPALGMSLATYVEQRVDQAAATVGFNVQFCLSRERPLEYGKPLFRQRHYLQVDYTYCKPLVSKVPLQWHPGFHACRNRFVTLNHDLILFHLRSMDPDIALARLRTLNRVQRSENSIQKGQSAHFGWDEGTYLDRVFIGDQRAFAGALPESEFSQVVSQVVKYHSVLDLPALTTLKNVMLQVPERFADSIVLPPRK